MASLQHPGAPLSTESPGLLLFISVATVLWLLVFPHFPPGEEQFPKAGMEHKQKVMDSAVRKQPEAALVEERIIPEVYFPPPLPLFTNIQIPVG